MFGFYLQESNIDVAQKVHELLQKYGLDTVAGATDKMPIIIECFEKPALIRFSELSDLPLV